MKITETRELAKKLAQENVRVEESISKIYWVPKADKIYLIEVDETSIPSDNYLRPMYFSPENDIPLPSGIAMITPDEYGQIELPEEWGSWEQLETLWSRESESANGA